MPEATSKWDALQLITKLNQRADELRQEIGALEQLHRTAQAQVDEATAQLSALGVETVEDIEQLKTLQEQAEAEARRALDESAKWIGSARSLQRSSVDK